MITLEEIKSDCQEIIDLLEKKVNINDGNAVALYMDDLRGISGFITTTEAKAVSLFNIKANHVVDANKGLSPTMLKYKIQAEAWEEAQYVKITERLGKNWSTVMDGLRSLLSKLKTDKDKGY